VANTNRDLGTEIASSSHKCYKVRIPATSCWVYLLSDSFYPGRRHQRGGSVTDTTRTLALPCLCKHGGKSREEGRQMVGVQHLTDVLISERSQTNETAMGILLHSSGVLSSRQKISNCMERSRSWEANNRSDVLRNPKVHYLIHNNSPLNRILNSVHSLTLGFFNNNFYV
jgi:hypothetical protein